ncbi:MAG TPA: glycosyltransferase [Candidatus Paceibacterota bacterium]|nr:glycosyltransferase [Candidatus Paceibacterota bacterium]
MASAVSAQPRVVVDGKFFRLGEKKFFVKGVAYGPFPPNAQGQPFPSPEQTALDFDQIAELGANVIRVYYIPPRWLLDLAQARGLKIFIDIPWSRHLCFDSVERREEARETVRQSVCANVGHPAVFAYSVANEIPADIVRWTGAKAVSDFIDELVLEAKRADPECLCTFSNYPPTEFLNPQAVDFVCFNVYLHQEPAFKNYLARLQMSAEAKPLVLGEFGIDSLREGEAPKCEMLSWQIEDAFRAGLAGTVVFTFTDEWFRNNQLVTDWKMGLVDAERWPKESFGAVQRQFNAAPYFPLARVPRVSVVVASYNGERTLRSCLESLQRLNYPDYEVILVDDGSTDGTREIAAKFPNVCFVQHKRNFGLSAARNSGIATATGEIIAFTDSDCRADEDWLYYLVGDLLDSEFAGIGGPNLLPPEDSPVAAAVMASPGGPAHVMLTDRQAEHIPGCNMAFYKWALEEIGGFDPIYTKAGDDVDVCWRLQQAGYRIGFSPSGFVWHYRRSTVAAYLKQQRGYGEAEALLVRKHPENFNSLGGGIWHGRIYTSSKIGVELPAPVIYHGLFGSAGFQKLYAAGPATTLMLCTTLEYHLFVTLPLWILSAVTRHFFPLAVASMAIPIVVCAMAAWQAVLPKNKLHWWSRPLVGLLYFLQPIARGWARYRGRLTVKPLTLASQESLDSLALRHSDRQLSEAQYWAQQRLERLDFLASILERLNQKGWPCRADAGWSEYDIEIYGSRWSHLQLTTVAEDHPGKRQLFRCRLRPVWSLTSRIAFSAMTGLELLIIGWFWRPWWCLLLLTLPVFVWLVLRDQRNLQSIATVFLDELAKDKGMVKVQPEDGVGKGGQG